MTINFNVFLRGDSRSHQIQELENNLDNNLPHETQDQIYTSK